MLEQSRRAVRIASLIAMARLAGWHACHVTDHSRQRSMAGPPDLTHAVAGEQFVDGVQGQVVPLRIRFPIT